MTKILKIATSALLFCSLANATEMRNPFKVMPSGDTTQVLTFMREDVVLNLMKIPQEDFARILAYGAQTDASEQLTCFLSSESEAECSADGDGSHFVISTSDSNETILLKGHMDNLNLNSQGTGDTEDKGLIFKRILK